MTKLCGVYLLTHIASGRKYVGQSVNIRSRWNQHSRGAKNTKLGCAVIKYGWAAFSAEILEICSRDALNAAEQKWVKFHDCVAPNGFNLTTGGSLRCEYSDETKAKIGKANALRVVSAATREKMSKRIITDETKAKISAAHSGKTISTEHRLALLEAAKRHAHTNIPRLAALNTGRKRTPEQIARMTAVHIGAKRSEETRSNISTALKGKLLGIPQTAEHRANVSAALMGHKHSPETLAKLSAAAKNRTPEHTAKITASKAANRLLRQNAPVATASNLFPQVAQR